MANPVIAALIADKIAQTSGADRITDTEVRDVLNALNAFIADNISYTTAIPFTCMNGKMAPHTVSGAITFTANTTNAMPWAGVGLRLTADGTNEPDFSDFKKASTSENYDNSTGVVNVVLFWYDGVDYWYSVYQEFALDALSVPGSFAAAVISGTQIDLSWADTNTSPNETNIKIYRNTVNNFGTATLIATKSADSVSHSDTGLTSATTYYYWILAAGDGVTTDDSATATDTATTTGGSATPVFDSVNWNHIWDVDTSTVNVTGSDVNWIVDLQQAPTTHPSVDDLQTSGADPQPDLVAASINGYDAIRHASGDLLNAAYSLSLLRPLTRGIVIKTPGTLDGTFRYIMGSPGSQQSDFGIHSSGKFFLYGGTSILEGTIVVQPDTVYVLIATFDGAGNDSLWVNGVEDVTGDSGSNLGTGGCKMGAAANGFVGDWTLGFDLDSVLSDPQIDDISTELMAKYGA